MRPQWVKAQLHKSPLLFGATRWMLFTLRRSLPPLTIAGLPGRLHPNDFMTGRLLPGGPAAYADYVEHSRRHFDILTDCLHRAGRAWHELAAVIDFACGYGRVTRWLPTVMPAARVTACDIQKEAVAWCAAEYGVRPLLADPELVATAFARYDLLFAISLVTHLSERRLTRLFSVLNDIIKPNGVVIFSSHGRTSARNATAIKEYLDPARIIVDLEKDGIVFIPYPHSRDKDIGDTFVTKEYIERMMARHAPMLSLVFCEEATFWDMQDCYVFKREAAG
jgi:SAM-dependent methyltransferase